MQKLIFDNAILNDALRGLYAEHERLALAWQSGPLDVWQRHTMYRLRLTEEQLDAWVREHTASARVTLPPILAYINGVSMPNSTGGSLRAGINQGLPSSSTQNQERGNARL